MTRARFEAGTEIVNGNRVGRDPRKMTAGELAEAGHRDRPLLAVIRDKCLDCCCGSQAEVGACTSVACDLWPYRMNKNPMRKRELTDDQREEMTLRLRNARTNREKSTQGA